MSTGNRTDFLAFGRPNFGEQELAAVADVLRSGWVGMGGETIAFERELAEYVGAPQVVSVDSCTSALFLSLLVSGIGRGDEVICPSLTWCSTANAAIYLGATPVFCDVDADTLSVTPETVLAHVTPRTRAVMVVHMGGLAADVAALRAALPAHIAIIEDAAHALGARYADGMPVGSSGNLTCFSFYANKNLSTGEGGGVAVFDPALAARLQSLRQQGLSGDAWKRFTDPQQAFVTMEEIGFKMNYTDLQAAIGRVQLRRQEEFAARRLAIAERYRDALAGPPLALAFQRGACEPAHARHLLVVRLPIESLRATRNELLLALRRRNIGASVHYSPLHLMPVYQRLAGRSSLPVTEMLADRIMTLPISASMSVDDVHDVVNQLRDVVTGAAEARLAS